MQFRRLIPWLLLIPALGAFVYLCRDLEFIQDDAYISYRYVANYLNGHGLVWNIGERVEGITNFGWTVFLVGLGSFGLDYISLSQVFGCLFGLGTLLVTFAIARTVLRDVHWWLALLPVYLLGVTQSFAYWAQAGLETAAFAFFAVLAFYFSLVRSWLLIAALAILVTLRPEGAFVAGLLILIEAVVTGRRPRFTFIAATAALIASLPFVWFKLTYYGSILPNPFYAKTNFSVDQLSNGIEYTWRFLRHYGLYGGALVLPLLLWRKLGPGGRAAILFVVAYITYITLVGGDVLKVHRFFVPLFGLMFVALIASLVALIDRPGLSGPRPLLMFAATVGIGVATVTIPNEYVRQYHRLEDVFTYRMQWLAQRLKESDPSNFAVALPTIGIFGYETLGHTVIDMLGLTDSTIARYSDPPIEGMQTTWKETKHNSEYILTRAPDYILFSTGVKPSAPAERALFLYPQFRDGYRQLGWYYRPPGAAQGSVQVIYKRMFPVDKPLDPDYSVEAVEEYKAGLDAYTEGDQRRAIAHYARAIELSPQPPYIYFYYQMAFSYLVAGENQTGMHMMEQVVAADSTIFMAHRELFLLYNTIGDTARAAVHRRWLERMVPWLLPRVDELARQFKERAVQLERSQ